MSDDHSHILIKLISGLASVVATLLFPYATFAADEIEAMSRDLRSWAVSADLCTLCAGYVRAIPSRTCPARHRGLQRCFRMSMSLTSVRDLCTHAAVLLGILLMSSQSVVAAPPSPQVKEICGAKMRSLCLRPWRLTPDAISNCMEENKSKLSPECQAFWVTAHICQQEMKQICGGLNPLTIKSCLKNSRDKFSQMCQETLKVD
ncbi:hypothetical protein [Neorhizobium sp. DT-125]|uniref:hypothetical protein n=1 Tax=Neorhizobium sp. DT-125 TaxID=3396163 RepID=UPI003F1BA358